MKGELIGYFDISKILYNTLIYYSDKSHLSSLVGKPPKCGHGQMQSSGKGKAGYQMMSSKWTKYLKAIFKSYFFFKHNHHSFAMKWESDDWRNGKQKEARFFRTLF